MTCPVRPLRQPTATTCGQTCVAMLTGASVDVACHAVGSRRPTRTREVAGALRSLGMRCANRLVPLRHVHGFVPRGVVKVAPPRRGGWHWVVWDAGTYVDPTNGLVYDAEDFAAVVTAAGWRLTSILPVEVAS